MAYSNLFLRDFRPVFLGILREKRIRPERADVRIIDGEGSGGGIFEPVGVHEVLSQLAEDLNFLTIYTERPAYFYEFTETMYEENGLIVELFSKEALRQMSYRRRGAGDPQRPSGEERERRGVGDPQGPSEEKWDQERQSGTAFSGSMELPGIRSRKGRARGGPDRRRETELILDFEWEGGCYQNQIRPGTCYVPIHKKPWKRGENLDIMIPIGYNTVIIRDVLKPEWPVARDRFEEAFYGS